jgi:hypothetical protein
MASRKIHLRQLSEHVQTHSEADALPGTMRHSGVARTRSELTLNSIHGYIDSCEQTLRGIRSGIALLNAQPDDRAILRQITEKLGNICLSADAWGFEDPCRIAAKILRLLFDLDGGLLQWSVRLIKVLDEGLSLLSSLLRDCEDSYRREFAIADLLSSLSKAGANRPVRDSLHSM